MWDEIGKLQFDFLVERGLRPDHYLLDIGCGSLRGGVHFIRYLSEGHYFGVEKEESLLEAGRSVELKRYALEEKEPQLFAVDDFDLSALPSQVEFDFMLAQSVFTQMEEGRAAHGVLSLFAFRRHLAPRGHNGRKRWGVGPPAASKNDGVSEPSERSW